MQIQFPSDFLDFLRLLNDHKVPYLLIGGYAVGYHGYPRATGDMDIWIPIDTSVAEKMVRVFSDFGFATGLEKEVFLRNRLILRCGLPPYRLEVTTNIDGVAFADCYVNRIETISSGVPVCIIGLEDLRKNKKASGRLKDLADLENLPEG